MPFDAAVGERRRPPLDLALGGDAERFQEFADAGVEGVLVHGGSASLPSPDQGAGIIHIAIDTRVPASLLAGAGRSALAQVVFLHDAIVRLAHALMRYCVSPPSSGSERTILKSPSAAQRSELRTRRTVSPE